MKKTLLLLLMASHITLNAGFLDDLIGKDRSFLEANGFKCTEFACITKNQNFFNIKLLDDSIEYVEAYTTDKDEVYRVAIYLIQNNKLKNREIDDAFYKALTKVNEKSKLAYDISKVSDKFGNETLITMTDSKRATSYLNSLRDAYVESMKQFNKMGFKK